MGALMRDMLTVLLQLMANGNSVSGTKGISARMHGRVVCCTAVCYGMRSGGDGGGGGHFGADFRCYTRVITRQGIFMGA